MALTVLTVLILILIAGYAAFFAAWNPDVINAVLLRYSAGDVLQSTPLWVLPLVGLLVGAIVMAFALYGPWSQMRRTTAVAREQLAAEREKSNQRAKKVNALIKQVKELKGRLGAASGAEEAAGEDTP
ncbi:MAG TPA: hypothetical protein VM283_02995 [Armatimonadota bacterium]|nr:hypothetical protein [Armatimonadota bacterium]